MAITDKIYERGSFRLETTTDGDVIKTDGECLFRSITGGTELYYKTDDGECRIRFTTRRVILERKGKLCYRFFIEPSHTSRSTMRTPYGSLDVEVTGEDMLFKPISEGFEALISYYTGHDGRRDSHILIALRVLRARSDGNGELMKSE